MYGFQMRLTSQIKFTILYNSQIKSNVGFGGEGKTGVPREKPLGASFLCWWKGYPA